MSEIDLRCPGCQEKFTADEKDAGSVGYCPICGTHISIPIVIPAENREGGHSTAITNALLATSGRRPEFPSIGNLDSICPYCNRTLDRRPDGKTRCPHCGQWIYLRYRPSDEKGVLVRKDQLDQFAEQCSVYYGFHDQYLDKRAPHPEFPDIGNLDSVCPHCNRTLEKRPRARKRCAHCEQWIYVRTRPSDGQIVLVTKEQTYQIEKQWGITAEQWRIVYDNRGQTLYDSWELHPEFPDIGNLDSVCPYCNGTLEKRRVPKKRCPHCAQWIYLRRRPSDGQIAFVTEAQTYHIDEQLSILYGPRETMPAPDSGGPPQERSGIGNLDAVCPHCNGILDKRPDADTAECSCPHCGQWIFSRRRPSDGQIVFLTMNQLVEIEGQWEIEAEKAHPEFPDIGNRDATCPYCGHRLERVPSRDRRCPKCGQLICLTVRPSDRQEVLATKDQAEQIDEQCSLLEGRHEEFLARKKRTMDETAKLTAQLGRQASDSDVKLSLARQYAEKLGREQNWAMFRQVIRGMGDICKRESRFKEALGLYLTACYLDLVWKRRCNELLAEGRANERKVWGDDPEGSVEPEAAWKGYALTIAPQIIAQTSRIVHKLRLDCASVESTYLEQCARLYEVFHPPLHPADAWAAIRDVLFSAEHER